MFFFQVRRPLLSSLPIFRATFIHPGGTDQEFRRVSELVRGPCKTVHPCTMATDGCLAKSLFFWVFFPLQFLVILGLVILGYDTMINLVFTCMQSRLSWMITAIQPYFFSLWNVWNLEISLHVDTLKNWLSSWGSVDAHPHPVWCWDAGWDARFNHRVLVWGYGYSPASSQPGAADAPMGTGPERRTGTYLV
jgi:hypothetical protein